MNTTAYITSGGKSLRFKEDKSLYLYRGKPLIQHVYDILSTIFPSVCVIANDVSKYRFLKARIIPDRIESFGPKAGLYTALDDATTERIFFCGCDMPNISAGFVRHMVALSADYDIVVPVVPKGYDPLHAVYSKQCLSYVKKSIESGSKKIIAFYSQVKVKEITVEEMRRFGDWEKMLFNINTSQDVSSCRKG